MAKRGRPRKQPELKVVKGNFAAAKAAPDKDKGALSLPPDAPEKPAELKGHAAVVWDDIVPKLAVLGVLQKVDRGQILAYCKASARIAEAEAEIDENGMFYWTAGRQGQHRKLNPAVGVIERAEKTIAQLAEKFGMTPTSRKQMGYDPAQLSLPLEESKTANPHDPTSGLFS